MRNRVGSPFLSFILAASLCWYVMERFQAEKTLAHEREIKLLEERSRLEGQLYILENEYEKCSKELDDLLSSHVEDKIKISSLIPKMKEDQIKVDAMKDDIIDKKDEIKSLQQRLYGNLTELLRLKETNRECENRLKICDSKLSSWWWVRLWEFLGLSSNA